MVRTTDPLGNVTTTDYDDRDVVTTVTNPNGILERRRVGPAGELLELIRDVAGLSVQHAWTYDVAARMLQYVDPMGQITQLAYDGVDRRTALARPGFSSTRIFGPDGRLSIERLASGAEVHFACYVEAGQ
jgi:YD repeat-containing protein